MRNIIFGVTAALILAAGTAPSLAAHSNNGTGHSNNGAAHAHAQAQEKIGSVSQAQQGNTYWSCPSPMATCRN